MDIKKEILNIWLTRMFKAGDGRTEAGQRRYTSSNMMVFTLMVLTDRLIFILIITIAVSKGVDPVNAPFIAKSLYSIAKLILAPELIPPTQPLPPLYMSNPSKPKSISIYIRPNNPGATTPACNLLTQPVPSLRLRKGIPPDFQTTHP